MDKCGGDVLFLCEKLLLDSSLITQILSGTAHLSLIVSNIYTWSRVYNYPILSLSIPCLYCSGITGTHPPALLSQKHIFLFLLS